MAAMMPMMATTIMSSISEKPRASGQTILCGSRQNTTGLSVDKGAWR